MSVLKIMADQQLALDASIAVLRHKLNDPNIRWIFSNTDSKGFVGNCSEFEVSGIVSIPTLNVTSRSRVEVTLRINPAPDGGWTAARARMYHENSLCSYEFSDTATGGKVSVHGAQVLPAMGFKSLSSD